MPPCKLPHIFASTANNHNGLVTSVPHKPPATYAHILLPKGASVEPE